jgi:hypothetical protein
MSTGITSAEYWGMLGNAGIARNKRLPESDNWMANNRADEHFPVPDPSTLSPEQRRVTAEYYIGHYGE